MAFDELGWELSATTPVLFLYPPGCPKRTSCAVDNVELRALKRLLSQDEIRAHLLPGVHAPAHFRLALLVFLQCEELPVHWSERLDNFGELAIGDGDDETTGGVDLAAAHAVAHAGYDVVHCAGHIGIAKEPRAGQNGRGGALPKVA